MGVTFPYVFVVGAFGVAGLHLVLLVLEVRHQVTGVRVRGVVVDWREVQDGETNVVYYPIVRFTTVEGIVRAAETRGSAPGRYARAGREVSVVYRPSDPAQVSIAEFGSLSRLGSVGWIVGGVAVGAFLLVFWPF